MQAIFLTERKSEISRVYPPSVIARLENYASIDKTPYCKADIEASPAAFKDVRFIFSTWGMPHFTEREIGELFPALECLFYAAGSVQSFAREFLACGVKVFSAWQANAVPVAEYVVSQIILANKGYFAACRMASCGDYEGAKMLRRCYPGNFDTPVGIIGTGAVGRLVCKMLKPYRLRVLASSIELTPELALELGVEISDIDRIFRTCQVVSNHVANLPATVGMFRQEHFESMVPYGVFLNTGRGAQVAEDDLCRVLAERQDLTAVLDVTDPEPPEENSPLCKLPNILLTPHIAGSNGQEVWRMAEWMAQEYDNYVSGKDSTCRVTLQMLENMA
ncbi:MAG: hydroxyacid dehydrogenase [Clostridia bacterium]|nr:hydroxyacid dehydrogenase [Clostridia bacterium]MBR5903815.1 hydroxyacid dehydrogenase [Clostridia bacterium]